MYYIHNFFTQYVIFTQDWRKKSKQNWNGAAKTPLEVTQVLHPVFGEERFRNEFFLCENRKTLN